MPASLWATALEVPAGAAHKKNGRGFAPAEKERFMKSHRHRKPGGWGHARNHYDGATV